MELWTKHHRALLNALRADALVPSLVSRLSCERCSADAEQTRLLRDWAASLRQDPGWQVIEAHIDRPRAWPAVWRRGVEAGWSPRTDHHHALLFARFCGELVDGHDLEVARYAWRECVEAWLRVFDSDYIDRLLDKLSAADGPARRSLLFELADARHRELVGALGLEKADPAAHFDRRRARFGWRALEWLDQRLDEATVDHPALSGLRHHVNDLLTDTTHKLVSRFGAMVDDLDLSEDDVEAVSRPFAWVREVFAILPIGPTVAARVADATVDVAWKLKKLELDPSDALMPRLLQLASPFNDKLAGFIESGEAFGHNSTCADFLVFQGEHGDGADRREQCFERALQACPGHRNASMMLSYERLREVSDLLLRLRLMPAALQIVPGTSERVEAALGHARALLDDAHELFPANENIAEYRQQIAAQAQRLGASFSE